MIGLVTMAIRVCVFVWGARWETTVGAQKKLSTTDCIQDSSCTVTWGHFPADRSGNLLRIKNRASCCCPRQKVTAFSHHLIKKSWYINYKYIALHGYLSERNAPNRGANYAKRFGARSPIPRGKSSHVPGPNQARTMRSWIRAKNATGKSE